jgi:hypothetical protein
MKPQLIATPAKIFPTPPPLPVNHWRQYQIIDCPSATADLDNPAQNLPGSSLIANPMLMSVRLIPLAASDN